MRAAPYIIAVTVAVLGSCTEIEMTELNANNPRIKKALEQRKKDYAGEYMFNCRRDMIEKASSYVDSLISEEINYQLSDSIVFPPRPDRPGWPGPVVLKDEAPQPVFREKIILHRDTTILLK